MPPWHADPHFGHFQNDARLSDNDKATIARWVAAGAPEGDPKNLPEPPHFAEGWMIPEPDQVIYMADKPYDVPATGVVEYQMFVADPGWTEDKWISAIEPRPGNPAVVHHILIFILPPDGRGPGGLGSGGNDFTGAFRAGSAPRAVAAGHRPPRAGRLEADLPDALHAQRLAAAGPQLPGREVRRSQDGQAGSRGHTP